jgi:hypothetical protein
VVGSGACVFDYSEIGAIVCSCSVEHNMRTSVRLEKNSPKLLRVRASNLPGAVSDFESDATRCVFGTTPVSKKR